jgi:peptidyl-prolyl cis-trans isomerase SurA
MNYSEDPNTSTNGGDMGFLPESSLKPPQLDAAISRAVLALQPGHMTAVVQDKSGYHIVRLVAKEPAGQRDLNDPRVKQAIREQLKQRREQLLKAAYYEALHNDARVENFLAEDIMKTGSK